MSVRTMRIRTPCPACQRPTVDYTATELDVPYFEKILQTLFACESCGFRHTDAIIGRSREPQRVTLRTRTADDMMARVVRSTSGTIRIPELGVTIEPGPASDAFVSNVEGVLVRVGRIVAQLFHDADDDDQRARCQDLIDRIEHVKAGVESMTLILEDPYGNSAIVHDDAVVERIPPGEAESLPRGEITFDVRELEPSGDGHNS